MIIVFWPIGLSAEEERCVLSGKVLREMEIHPTHIHSCKVYTKECKLNASGMQSIRIDKFMKDRSGGSAIHSERQWKAFGAIGSRPND